MYKMMAETVDMTFVSESKDDRTMITPWETEIGYSQAQ